MSLMAANEESDPSAILNGFWVTLFLWMLQFSGYFTITLRLSLPFTTM